MLNIKNWKRWGIAVGILMSLICFTACGGKSRDDSSDIRFSESEQVESHSIEESSEIVPATEEDEILEEPGEHKLFVVGELGRHYYANKGVEIDTNFLYTVQKPTMHRARDIAEVILSQYERGELDEVYIVYTRMENSMLTTVEKMKILPLERSSFNEMKMPLNIHREAIALYPSAEAVLDSIVPNYVVGMIYGCLVEAYASEHNARMTAMQSATDSAQEIIKDLSIIYNRARQAAITQEITEVCAGAKAQKRKRK